MRRCIVLHERVAAAAGPDEQDTLAAAAAVERALAANNFAVERLTLGLDLGPAAARLAADPPDLVFNLVESLPGVAWPGPAGLAAAAMLEGAGVPFTGSRLAALALSTDKPAAKRVLRQAGLPVAPGSAEGWPGPFIIKHHSEHASFGLGGHSVVLALPESLPAGWFAEAFLPGREFNLSLLEGPAGVEVLPPAELIYAADWPAGMPHILDYAGKWCPDDPLFARTERCFDGIAAELSELLAQLSLRAWQALGLAGYGRVDLRLDAAGVAHVLEVNANPALAPDAGFAAAAERAGIGYATLIGRIADAALVSCPRSSLPYAANEGDQQATENKELVSRPGRLHMITNFRIGTLARTPEPGHETIPAPRAPPHVALRRTLVATDEAAVVALCRATNFFNEAELAIAAELLREVLARGPASGYRFVLAEPPHGTLLGYACFGPVPATAGAWDLYWIVVHPAAQGAGVGSRLLREVLAVAAAEGATHLYAETAGRPLYAPTRRFYAATGFALQAILPDFYAPGDAKQIWTRPVTLDHPALRG